MEETTLKTAKPSLWQTIARLCKDHPVVGPLGVAGALSSIIAVPLAVAFWWWPTTAKRELTYAVQPLRTSILQVNRQSDIAVTYRGKPIVGDLTAAQIMFANAGDIPIEEHDVLSPIVLVISNASYIETSYSVAPKPGTQFLPIPTTTNAVFLQWNILEHGDNPVIQVVYAGRRDAPINLYGRIKGQEAIKQVPWPSRTGAVWSQVALASIGSIGGLLAGMLATRLKTKGKL